MTHLLVKDLSRVDELDRQAAKRVRGGILIISKPTEPSPWPSFPGMPSMPWPPMHFPVPPVHSGGGCNDGGNGGGGGYIIPYHATAPQDPRLQ
ncbi:hypothetical protein ACFQ3P_18570 [Paraburkholderia sabiae]|jgi:hypothetical protein|uniref:Uncharacterized protein n=1 Tax=Paraburkholderia sabiae TaxID=273251 RepID=A0ABU9QAQ8_9BURK|nr:hypothetical protein [Paraburkholderia sabiae]WJZ72544.1 hypothetical protein QEN71_20555 [Paraburkholderia sabiae]CAD6535841.1 hypothetical protein LMG24235_03024 [Paraburkholderia sabiae]